ncbi:MAG: prepilin-type N-terminal cleavage/methylation domain-containing protein [Actinomycetota bacterium]
MNVKDEHGFTLIEILAVTALLGLLMALGASAFQGYARRQSLDAATDRVVGELRAVQQRVVSESNPLVYGARVVEGSGDLELIRYNPNGALGSRCSIVETVELTGGMFSAPVQLRSASFSDPEPVPTCTTELGVAEYVFFFARGTATAGSLQVYQPQIGASETITITDLTARVRRS